MKPKIRVKKQSNCYWSKDSSKIQNKHLGAGDVAQQVKPCALNKPDNACLTPETHIKSQRRQTRWHEPAISALRE